MGDIVRYIIAFLLYGNQEAAEKVVYSADVESNPHRIVIIPACEWAAPFQLPNMEIPQTEKLGNGTIVIRTDIIYNSFFFISRAEELINPKRDEHGRFLAQYSLLGQQNRLLVPLVDEYSRLLMKLLDLPLPTPSFSQISLTHDIDTLAYYRHIRGALGGLKRGHWRDVIASRKDLQNDPAYTFPWLMQEDVACAKQIRQTHNAPVQAIYFVKDTHGKGLDYPQYDLQGGDLVSTMQFLQTQSATLPTLFGLHSSAQESEPLQAHGIGTSIDYHVHRSHYLSCSIRRMQQLVDAGITDDYTMGFPDMAGFRLQTTRPVRWINPQTMQLTSLVLHPLTVMDCTLSNEKYMNLTEDEAYFYCQSLFERVRQHGGELNLLWHNTSFLNNPYHSSLYPKLLALL